MGHERLELLLLLITEQEMISNVDLDAVTQEFNNMVIRRMSHL